MRVCVCGPLWGCVWAYVSRECVCSRGGGACVSLYVCAHVSACVPVPVCRCVCPGSFPGTSTHHQQPQRSCPTASDPPTGTKPPTFSGTQAPRREGSAHLLLQLLLVALPGQLVLILGPLGRRGRQGHISAGSCTQGRPGRASGLPRAISLAQTWGGGDLPSDSALRDFAGLRRLCKAVPRAALKADSRAPGTAPGSQSCPEPSPGVRRPPSRPLALLRPGAAASPRSGSSSFPRPAPGSARS